MGRVSVCRERTPSERPRCCAQRAVRMAFFLWLSVVNLVGLSTMWARMADVFGSEAGTRLFGFLGAGATCGKLHAPIHAAPQTAPAKDFTSLYSHPYMVLLQLGTL